jgi:hypothetical protein
MLQKILNLSLLVAFLLAAGYSLEAQNGSTLSLEKIMAGDEWIGRQPGNPWWSHEGGILYFMWNPENNPSDSLYSYDPKTGRLEKVPPRKRMELPPGRVSWDANKRRMVYVKDGDLFMTDIRRFETIQLTDMLRTVSSPSFTLDGKGISYVSGNNLYIFDLGKGTTRQITDFRHGQEPSESTPADREQWLRDQQTDLFRVLQERQEREELRRENTERDRPQRPLRIYTGTSFVANMQLSPGEQYVAYLLYSRPDARQTRIPEFVTDSGYTEDFPSNPKVGSPQMTVSAGIYDIENRKSYGISFENIPGIRDVPGYMREYGFLDEELEEDREVVITSLIWSDDGKNAVVNIRARDNKDRWIMLLDPSTGELEPLDRQRDEAWIAGPGINVSGESGMGWMPNTGGYGSSRKSRDGPIFMFWMWLPVKKGR